MEQRKRRFGDRSEGRRIRTISPIDRVSPYIMKTRNSSSNFIADSVDIEAMEKYIHEKRKEGLDDFGILHVFLAARSEEHTSPKSPPSTASSAARRFSPATISRP